MTRPGVLGHLSHRGGERGPTGPAGKAAVASRRELADTRIQTTRRTALSTAIERSDWSRASELDVARRRQSLGPIVEAAISARQAAIRSKFTTAGAQAKKRRAANRARRYVTEAKRLRAKHQEWTLGAIIGDIRRPAAQAVYRATRHH